MARSGERALEFDEKDALIEQIKARAVFAESQVGAKKEKDEDRKIALLKGWLHLKRYDAKWGDIDLPKIYDDLRAWMADESSTGTLAVFLEERSTLLPSASPEKAAE